MHNSLAGVNVASQLTTNEIYHIFVYETAKQISHNQSFNSYFKQRASEP